MRLQDRMSQKNDATKVALAEQWIRYFQVAGFTIFMFLHVSFRLERLKAVLALEGLLLSVLRHVRNQLGFCEKGDRTKIALIPLHFVVGYVHVSFETTFCPVMFGTLFALKRHFSVYSFHIIRNRAGHK
jgi:hypothetical protein